jgi:hypothetical protein
MVIKPGTVNNIAKNALERVVGLTINAQGDPGAKTVVDKRIYQKVKLK